MGRPLFSQAYPSAPVVRTEPDPAFSKYERWTHWNPFDPDSEEFFANDPVWEAFVDPTPGEEDEQALAAGESPSSGSSEGSLSDRGSPMAVGPDDPVRLMTEAYPAVDWAQPFAQPPVGRADVRAPDAPPQHTPRFAHRVEAQAFVRGTRPRSATFTAAPQRLPPGALRGFLSPNPVDGLPRTSNISPISVPSRVAAAHRPASPATPRAPFIPATSPSQPLPLGHMTPAPAPRILSWSRPPMSAGSPPQVNGPLTNPGARLSLAHIVPTLIRVRDVVI